MLWQGCSGRAAHRETSLGPYGGLRFSQFGGPTPRKGTDLGGDTPLLAPEQVNA